jgi:hypothetical protein
MKYETVLTACGAEHPYALDGDTLSQSDDIRADYRGGHYFDLATLQWFGSWQFTTVAPGASVELQRNAPDGVGAYRVQLWRNSEHGTPEPWFGCRHDDRTQATACARKTAAALR